MQRRRRPILPSRGIEYILVPALLLLAVGLTFAVCHPSPRPAQTLPAPLPSPLATIP